MMSTISRSANVVDVRASRSLATTAGRPAAGSPSAEFEQLVAQAGLGEVEGRRGVARDAVGRLMPILITQALDKMLPGASGAGRTNFAGDTWRSFLTQELGKVLAQRMAEQDAQAGDGKRTVEAALR